MTENIIARVRKLLELAKSDNINEAANAAMNAQKLMAQHNIDEAVLAVSRDEAEQEKVEDDILVGGKTRIPTWRKKLGTVVAQTNLCDVYFCAADIHVVGAPRDASTVRYLFTWLTREINRLCDAAMDERSLSTGTTRRVWANNFRLGAVSAVAIKLAEANESARKTARQNASAQDSLGTGAALVRVNTALVRLEQRKTEVRSFMNGLHLRTVYSGRNMRGSSDGRAAGVRAGQSIDVARGKNAALPADRKQLRS